MSNKLTKILFENSNDSEAIRLFKKLADSQRGKPERIMVATQHEMGGGVMSVQIEHIGDLTHRMAEAPQYGVSESRRNVYEKVDRCLRHFNSGYGFEREFMSNIKSNAQFYNTDVKSYLEKAKLFLKKYADSHRDLTVYNELQHYAKYAAISLGLQKFEESRHYLTRIKSMSDIFNNEILSYFVYKENIVPYVEIKNEEKYIKKYITQY